MGGTSINYIPFKLNKHKHRPWNSISHMSHIRGSSVYKWHTALMNYGSFSVMAGAIMKLFDLNESTITEKIGVYCLLTGGIGGLIVANFEVYVSSSFARGYNRACDVIHTFGAFCYAIIGNLAFAMYNEFDWKGSLLFILTVVALVFYRVNRRWQYSKNLGSVDKEGYERWVHNMSRLNIGWEISAIIPSAIAMCGLVYQFGC